MGKIVQNRKEKRKVIKKQMAALLSVLTVILLLAGCSALNSQDSYGEQSADLDRWADSAKEDAINFAEVASSRKQLQEKMLTYGLSPLYDYALENCSVDWAEKALIMYEESTETSPAERKAQLEKERFQPNEIEYAMAHCTVDWNEQARQEVFITLLGETGINTQYRTFSKQEVEQDLKDRGFSDGNISYAFSHFSYNWGINAQNYLIENAKEVQTTNGYWWTQSRSGNVQFYMLYNYSEGGNNLITGQGRRAYGFYIRCIAQN